MQTKNKPNKKKARKIPATMATQHPDNASSPFWKKEGESFVRVSEELDECVACLKELGVEEFMWDWEGKYTDEAVMDKFFANHLPMLKKNQLGKDQFLTFRIPNVWQEKGYSLIRAFMVILTSEDLARFLKVHSNPLFEVILPMTEKADQLIYLEKTFKQLAQFKNKVFDHTKTLNTDTLEIIPLVESVENQMSIFKLMEEYSRKHQTLSGKKLPLLRPFLARSDPAMMSGIISNVLANKMALSECVRFSDKYKIPTYPIIGVGSLVFRGGLNPNSVDDFLKEYRGVKTVTVQSAFRYDYPKNKVVQAIKKLGGSLPKLQAAKITPLEFTELEKLVKKSNEIYQKSLLKILGDLKPFFDSVPGRRERRLHIGLLAYKRKLGSKSIPRAISFTAAFYSLGVPPEFIGIGRFLKSLNEKELSLVLKYYVNLRKDLDRAGRFINYENLNTLAKTNPEWSKILMDIKLAEELLNLKLMPKTQSELEHRNLSSNVLLLKNKPEELKKLITETAKIRKSLG